MDQYSGLLTPIRDMVPVASGPHWTSVFVDLDGDVAPEFVQFPLKPEHPHNSVSPVRVLS